MRKQNKKHHFPKKTLIALGIFLFAATGAGIYNYVFSPTLTKQSSELSVSTANAATGNPLPFDIPSTATLRATNKKVFAHYFTPQPSMINNKPPDQDYYTLQYMTPGGENGKHAAYGGFLRDRPMYRSVQTRTDWQVANMEDEVRQAIGAGIDGFIVDVLQLEGDPDIQVWNNAKFLMDASNNVDQGFECFVMLDLSGSLALKDVSVLASNTNTLLNKPCAYKLPDGRTMLAVVFADKHDAVWWTNFLSIMKNTYGIDVAFNPVFLDEQPYRASFAPISYMMGNWGNDNPGWNSTTNTFATSARGRVKAVKSIPMKWIQPIRTQDERPNGKTFGEAENSQNLRNTWEIARVENADFAQLVTWNDYSEGASTAPSLNNGFAWLDINSYYATWFKAGTAPTITRDAVYLSHRKQFASQAPTLSYPDLMLPHGGESSPTRDTIEALTFLTAPGTVTITAGSTTFTCNTPAGVSTCVAPLALGTVAAKVTRNSAVVTNVTSKWVVTATPYVQDMAYVMASSGRTGNDLVAPSANTSDLNNDGIVNVFDLSILLSKWGTNSTPSDINVDGTVNVFDLSILLSKWG